MGISRNEVKNLNPYIKRYIKIGLDLHFFNEQNIDRITERLKRVNIVIDNDCLGDAHTTPLRNSEDLSMSEGIVIAINETKLNNNSKYYFREEVIYHELTHAISGIYEDWFETLDGYRNTPKRINKYKNFSIKDEDKKRFRQIGYSWGMIDEFVAQYVAQKFVEYQYGKDLYDRRSYTLNLTNPAITYESSLSDYHEYEEIVSLFIEYYYGKLDIDEFVIESFDKDIVENIDLNDYPDVVECLKRNTSIEPRAVNFFIKDDKKEEFETLFNKYFSEDFDLYDKDDIIESKLFGDGDENVIFKDALGDYLAIAKTNKTILYGGSEKLKSQHAGYTDDEIYVPLIIIEKD